MLHLRRTRALAGLLLAVSCAPGKGDAQAPWTAVDPARLDAAQSAQVATATTARQAMFGELVGALTRAIEADGPAGAIAVCRDTAPQVAARVGEQHGVALGRTSWKLRNPDNAAPAWAAPLLADHPAEERVAVAPDGRLGVLSPIHVAGKCLACHGAAEALAPEVRDALAALYPDDRATGYQDGDLRGWFWVEVPAR